MAEFSSIEEARKFFTGDRFATDNGMQIDEMGDDYSVVSMELTDAHRNAMGGVMGGVTFTLADFAFAVVQNNIHMPSVAQQVSINFLAPPSGKRLIARADLIRNGRTSTVVSIMVKDENGRDIALVTATGCKLLKNR